LGLRAEPPAGMVGGREAEYPLEIMDLDPSSSGV